MFYFVQNQIDNYFILNFIFKLKFYYQNYNTIILAGSNSKQNRTLLKIVGAYAQRFFEETKSFDKHLPLFVAKFYSAGLKEKNILVYFNYLNDKWEVDVIVDGLSINQKAQYVLKKLNVGEYLKHNPNENKKGQTKLIVVESLINAFIDNYQDSVKKLKIPYLWKNIEIICLQDTALEFYNTLFEKYKINKQLNSFTFQLDNLSFLIQQTKPDFIEAAYIQSLFPDKYVFVVGANGDDVCLFYKNVRYRIYDFIYNSKYRIYPWKTIIPFLNLVKYTKLAKDKNVVSFRWYFDEYVAKTDLLTFNFMLNHKINFKNSKIVFYKWILKDKNEINMFLNTLKKEEWFLQNDFLIYKQPAFTVSLKNFKTQLIAYLVIHKQINNEDINTIFNYTIYNILKNFNFEFI